MEPKKSLKMPGRAFFLALVIMIGYNTIHNKKYQLIANDPNIREPITNDFINNTRYPSTRYARSGPVGTIYDT